MGMLDGLFRKKKSRKRQGKPSDKNTSHQVPRGIHHRGKIDPYAALTTGKVHLKRVTGKDLDEVQEVLLIELLASWKNLSIDPNTTFSDSYVFDIFWRKNYEQ